MPAQNPILPFGEYKPDMVDYDGINSQAVTNVVRSGSGYAPFPDFAALTASLPGPCRGAFTAQNPNGTVSIFAATATKLYQLNNSTFGWVDVSRGGGTYTVLTSTAQWQFVQFNNLVLATQANDVLQVFTLGVSSAFSNNPGSPPQAAYIAVVGSFVVLLGLLSLPFREVWSALGDSTGWTAGLNQSDFQDFTDGGITQGVAGGEYGVIFQARVIRQMTYAPGSSYIFQFTRICEDQGLLAPYALAKAASQIIFLSAQGWQELSPGTLPAPIGKEKIDKAFIADWDSANPQLLVGVNDPNAARVYFGYKSNNGIAGLMDTILAYDYVLQSWSPIHGTNNGAGIEYLFTGTKPGVTLETLDVAATTTIAITGAAAGTGNIALQSNAFSNAAWSNTNSTLTPASGVSPDGTNDAWLWQRNSSGNANIIQSAAKAASPLSFTFSISAKLGTSPNSRYLSLFVDDGGGVNTAIANFDLLTGVVSANPAAGGSFSNAVATMKFFPNGSFWRCALSVITNSVATIRWAFAGNVNNTINFATDSASNTSLLVFGAQMEALSFAATYLPTTTVAISRVRLTVATINLPVLTQPTDGAFSPLTLFNNDIIDVSGVGGTVEANGEGHPIAVIDATHIDLQDIPFVNAYTSGGLIAGPLDAMVQSFDNYSFSGFPALAAFSNSNSMGFFNGPNLQASLESAEHGLPGQRIYIDGFRPITDAATVTGTVSRRERLQDSRQYGILRSLTSQGWITCRVSTRYSRARIVIPAGTIWTYATGVEPNARPNGKSGGGSVTPAGPFILDQNSLDGGGLLG